MSSRLAELKNVMTVNTLRGCRLFAGLPAADLEKIAAITAARSLADGEYLFHEGGPARGFYIVQQGAINVHRVNAAGKEQVIHIFRPGESFAEAALATERGYPADARAVGSSQVLMVQKDGILALIKRQPDLALRMLASMSGHLRVLVGQIEDLTLKDVETRLANWLLKRCPASATANTGENQTGHHQTDPCRRTRHHQRNVLAHARQISRPIAHQGGRPGHHHFVAAAPCPVAGEKSRRRMNLAGGGIMLICLESSAPDAARGSWRCRR